MGGVYEIRGWSAPKADDVRAEQGSVMETILNWSWPHEEAFRFYIAQFFFWSGYFFLVGLVGTIPYRFTKYRQTAWTTFVLGAMGTLIAYLSQFLFKLENPLDMLCPYAIVVSVVATILLAPFVSLFAFVFQPTEEEEDEYDDEDYERAAPPRRRETRSLLRRNDVGRSDEYYDEDEQSVKIPRGYGETRSIGGRRRLRR